MHTHLNRPQSLQTEMGWCQDFEGGVILHSMPGRKRINFFKGGLEEVNFKLSLVYRVRGCVAIRRAIYSTCTLERDYEVSQIHKRT